MSAEARTMREGTLWWVHASGTGTTWNTASAPTSGLLGFVTDFSFTSAEDVIVISERGVPHHYKRGTTQPIQLSFSFIWTGDTPTASAGSGHSVPIVHLEHRADRPEVGDGTSGFFHQFHGVPFNSQAFTEAAEGDNYSYTTQALAMVGPTGSGYLS